MLPLRPAGVVTLISIILVAVNFRMILENMLKQVDGLGQRKLCLLHASRLSAIIIRQSIVVAYLSQASRPRHAV